MDTHSLMAETALKWTYRYSIKMPSFSLSRQQHFSNLAVHQNKIQGDADNLSFSLLVCVQYLLFMLRCVSNIYDMCNIYDL